MTRLTFTAILGVAFLTACALQAPTAPGPAEAPDPGDAVVVTDRSSYTLQRGSHGWQGEIAFEYTNATDRTISILNCRETFGLRLEKLEAGEWIAAWNPVVLMCLSRPIEIKPGATYRNTLDVFGGFQGSNHHPQFQVDEIDGTYRLVIESAYWNYDHDGPQWGE
jgi:hypothetical protein